jgi:hypothetical protein
MNYSTNSKKLERNRIQVKHRYDKLRSAGLVPVQVWIRPEDSDNVKRFATSLRGFDLSDI